MFCLEIQGDKMNKYDIKQILRNNDIKKYAAVAFLSGIIIMSVVPKESDKTSIKQETENQEIYQNDMEEKLEQLLLETAGAGDVKVMITYKSGKEKVIATESKISEDISNEKSASSDKNSSSTVSEITMAYSNNSLNSGEPIIVKEKMPEIEGVVVIAQGGGNIEVKDSIIRAVKALFDVPAHKIEVLKMGE